VKTDETLANETQQRIAEAIRKLMRERGLTQSELAKLSGVPQPRISVLLSGSRGKYSKELLRLLDTLGLELTASTTPKTANHDQDARRSDDTD